MPPTRPPPRPALTHFLCLPLVTAASRPQLSESLASFHADVTSATGFNVPAEAVRPVDTLHLTLGVMSLPQKEEELDRAVALLAALKPREILSRIKPPSADARAGYGPLNSRRRSGKGGGGTVENHAAGAAVHAAGQQGRGPLRPACRPGRRAAAVLRRDSVRLPRGPSTRRRGPAFAPARHHCQHDLRQAWQRPGGKGTAAAAAEAG